jgi:hypothetical protein
MDEDDYGLGHTQPTQLSAPLHSLAIALTSSFAGAVLTNPIDVLLLE